MTSKELYALEVQLENISDNIHIFSIRVPKLKNNDYSLFVIDQNNHENDIKAIRDLVHNALQYIRTEAEPIEN